MTFSGERSEGIWFDSEEASGICIDSSRKIDGLGGADIGVGASMTEIKRNLFGRRV